MREPVRHERHLVGFGNRLKDRDRVKGKVAESLAVKGRTVAEAMQLIPTLAVSAVKRTIR